MKKLIEDTRTTLKDPTVPKVKALIERVLALIETEAARK